MTLASEQIDQIVGNQYPNPFEILGPHQVEENGRKVWVVRSYVPNAEAISVMLPTARQEYPMHSVHHPHFFSCTIDLPELTNYQLKITEGGHERVIYDPYAFTSPLMSDFDIHLFAEGNHHRIYEKLGAHPIEVEGIKGIYFAVWAPNARNTSVIGDFNNWDGRKHQMARRNNGIWELFIPELTVGTSYKYEIKNQNGDPYEKTDPYGFYQEARPKTASIVADLTYPSVARC